VLHYVWESITIKFWIIFTLFIIFVIQNTPLFMDMVVNSSEKKKNGFINEIVFFWYESK
jgi:hypothetical protein